MHKHDFDCRSFIQAVTGIQNGLYIGIGRKEDGQMIRENGTVEEFAELAGKLSEEDFWFCASALKSEYGQSTSDCICTQSILVDLDYGSEGHKKKSYFDSEEEALACLRGLPVPPSLVWNTGHGLQAAFLLDEPVYYDDDERVLKLEETKQFIYAATHSDFTQSREHLFRVPFSMNLKRGCKPVRGRIIEL